MSAIGACRRGGGGGGVLGSGIARGIRRNLALKAGTSARYLVLVFVWGKSIGFYKCWVFVGSFVGDRERERECVCV